METNSTISMHRILLLYKQYILLHYRLFLILIGATIVIIAGFHIYYHSVNYNNQSRFGLGTPYHQSIFLLAFTSGCLLWVGQAFPGLRSKEKTMEYLMLPASTLEKFLFEFFNRIVVFLIIFPIIYWAATNTVTGIFHAQIPEYTDFKLKYSAFFPKWQIREITLFFSIGFLLLTLPFTGATYFQKHPLVKTILAVAVIFGVFTLMAYLMVKGFGIDQYSPKDNTVLFMKDGDDAKLAGTCAAILGNLVILSIGYFNLKEKEV